LRARTSQAWISKVERGEVSPSIESLERLLRVMGERLVLGAERMEHDDHDRGHRERARRQPIAERLERALDFSEFAAELHGAARRER
jgi:transcriptional regulator with XRE-family HTH domain